MATKKLRTTRTIARTIAAAGLAAAMFSVTACSSGDSPDSSSGEPSGELQILVSSAAASDAAFEAVNKDFEAKYPDVKVTFSSVSNDNYPATKSSRLTAGNVDILVVKSMIEAPDFASDSASDDVLLGRSGGLVDLTDEPFMKNYSPSVLDAQAIDDKQYSLPTGLSYSTGVYYNKKVFADAGLEVPTTWSAFETVMDTLKSHGVTPFGVGGKDTWPAGLAMLGITGGEAPTNQDKHDLAAGVWDQSIPLDSGVPLTILQKTQKILENAQPNFSGAGYDEIPAGFAAGSYAMTVDGTWNSPAILSAVGDSFDVGYFPLPGGDNAEDNANLNGKIELQLGVATSAKNKEAALAWLEFISEPETYTQFIADSGFSPAQPDIQGTEFLNSIAQYTENFESAWDQIWVANNEAGLDAVYPFNYPALAPLGNSTADEAATAAQAAWSAAF
jgi:raffinose/stachyose/melibiose transport system substrate-binding protein